MIGNGRHIHGGQLIQHINDPVGHIAFSDGLSVHIHYICDTVYTGILQKAAVIHGDNPVGQNPEGIPYLGYICRHPIDNLVQCEQNRHLY